MLTVSNMLNFLTSLEKMTYSNDSEGESQGDQMTQDNSEEFL